MIPLWFTRRAGPLFASHLGMCVVHGALVRVYAGYETARHDPIGELSEIQSATLALALYALPFLLVSGPSGRLADRQDKAAVLRWTSIAGIAVAGLGAVGWVAGSTTAMLVAIALAGTQAAMALPARYAIVAQTLDESEWVESNASLLLGTLATGIVIALPYGDEVVLAGTRVLVDGVATDAAAPLALVVVSAGAALLAAFVPAVPTVEPADEVARERAQAAPRTLVRYPQSRWYTVLALTWYWAIGGMLLELLPIYVDRAMGAGPAITAWFLATFGAGTLLGTLGATALSRHRVELGLVPLGSIGMSLVLIDLWWVGDPFAGRQVTWSDFVTSFSGLRVSADLAGLAVSGVLVAVPLYSYLQLRSEPDIRGRLLGANQRLNAIGFVTATLLLVAIFDEPLRPYDVLLGIGVANILIAGVVYHTIAEFLLRFVAWAVSVLVYRVKVQGTEHIPEEGPAILVCNHVSYIDWLIIMASVRRPIRFVMYYKFMELPVMRYLFRQNKVIPIAGYKENPELLAEAYERVHAELADEWLVLVFPEGDLTKDGELLPFRQGVERMLERDPVPVVPMALNGLWGSFFSHKGSPAMTRPFRRVWSQVWVTIGPPIDGASVTAQQLGTAVAELRSRHPDP